MRNHSSTALFQLFLLPVALPWADGTAALRRGAVMDPETPVETGPQGPGPGVAART